jgi:hypothetical protein
VTFDLYFNLTGSIFVAQNMIYYIYVRTHKSICPIPFVIATDFQKICWSNSTPFVRALINSGFDNLGAQDGSVNHCFIVSDVVILEKCWGESNTVKLLERFSKDHVSNGRSIVKKLRSILAPVIKRPKCFHSLDLCELFRAQILALKPAPTRATSTLLPTAVEVQTAEQKNMITSFSLEAAEPEVKAPVEVTGEQDSLKLQIVGVGNLFDGVDDAALEESVDRRKPLLPTSIFFPVGSVVKVLADTRPGVRPRHAHSFMATVIAMTEDGQYDISPTVENKRSRRISGERLQVACIDGLDSLSRLGSPNAIAKKMVIQAQSALKKSQVEGEEVKQKLVSSRRYAKAERIKNVKMTRSKKEAAKAHQRSQREMKQLLNDSYLRAEEIKRTKCAEIKEIREAKNSETKSFLAKEMAIHVEKERPMKQVGKPTGRTGKSDHGLLLQKGKKCGHPSSKN